VKNTVDRAVHKALRQLPACATVDLAIVTVSTESDPEALEEEVVEALVSLLPKTTRFVGWVGSLGDGIASSIDKPVMERICFANTGGISITLGSLPAVSMRCCQGWNSTRR